MNWVALAASAAVGLVVGAGLNVVVDQVPRRLPLTAGKWRCPGCEAGAGLRDLPALVSWLVRRGQCRHGQGRVPLRHPLVEVATAGLFVAVTAHFGVSATVPAFWVFAAVLVAVAAVDFEHALIPNRIVYPGLAAGVPLLVIAALVEHSPLDLARAAVGGAIAFLALLAIHLVQPQGMGFGDVRLAGLIGVFLGWLSLGQVAVGLIMGFLVAAVVGLTLVLVGRAGRQTKLAFGPFLNAGAVIALFWGSSLFRLWRG